MRSSTPTRTPRRSVLAPLAVLVPAVLLLVLVLQALSASPSQASRSHAVMQHVTLQASAPQFPTTLTTGLVSVTLINDTKGETSAVFGRLNPGVTTAQLSADAAGANSTAGFEKLLLAATWLGGSDTVVPGLTQTTVLQLTTPGLYVGNVSSPTGPGHSAFFSVTAGVGTAALPIGAITLTLKDFKFVGLPTHLAAGNVTFRLTNTSSMVHEMQVARLDPGKTQHDALLYMESPQGQGGPPPAWLHDEGGMNILSPHHSADVTVHLVPGYYLVVCGMPDINKKSGEPHAMEGMITHFTVS